MVRPVVARSLFNFFSAGVGGGDAATAGGSHSGRAVWIVHANSKQHHSRGKEQINYASPTHQ